MENPYNFPVIPGTSKLRINNMSSIEMSNKMLVLVFARNHQRLIVRDFKLTREISNAAKTTSELHKDLKKSFMRRAKSMIIP